MKWDEESTAKLKELVYAGKSNKYIAQTMGINPNDVYNKRSQLGITMDKVNVVKDSASVETHITRSRDEIVDEIGKVINSKKVAEKKMARCDKRLVELSEELQLASKNLREVK